MLRVMAIDIGGSHIKATTNQTEEHRAVVSGTDLTPEELVSLVQGLAHDWEYDVISIGFPGAARHHVPVAEPVHLGVGWVGYDFGAAFNRPVKLVNDALMQAIGSYEGGRMLFLGLGTGLGSALIMDNRAYPTELAHLPYRKKGSFEDYLGDAGRRRMGKRKWRRRVAEVVDLLQKATQVDYVLIGGGNVTHLDELPVGARRGSNDRAFIGGFRLWDEGGIVT